jgi:glycosyltransferase involved in cell wall biosynthesis
MDNAPLVSARTITYNHAPYIKQCIEGVLMQKTTFPFEYIIGEDCSTDGTREIVLEYAQNHPDIIRVITSDANVGGNENSKRSLSACRGKYLASCEGDDYWTDPLKLQKQVDFLEAHLEYVMCFHNTMIKYEDGRQPHLRHIKAWDSYSLEELIVNFNDFAFPKNVTAGHTSSIVHRNGLIKDFPSWFSQSMSGDLPFQILLAQYGKAKYIDEVMSVHRIHSGGISSAPIQGGIIGLYENRIMMYEGLRGTLDRKYKKSVDQVLAMYYIYVGDFYNKKINLGKAFSFYCRADGSATALAKTSRSYIAHYLVSPFMQLLRRAHRVLLRLRQFWHDKR